MTLKNSPFTLEAFIVAELGKKGIVIAENRQGSEDLKTFCFKGHDLNTPSLSISKKTGRFHCFGCHIGGPSWNVLAALIGATPLGEGEGPDPFGTLNEEIGQRIKKAQPTTAALPWDLEPWQGGWRKVSARTMKKVKASEWYDDEMRCYCVMLPIYMYKELQGWVARRLDKKKERKYKNNYGLDVRYWFYPFDVVAAMHKQVVVLVEGPYDALRLIDNGIPALAVLGSGNYSPESRVHLINLQTKRVVVATDGDAAGDKCRLTMTPSLEEFFKVKQFYCRLKSDPGKFKQRELLELKKLL